MSATIENQRFASYFAENVSGHWEPAPVVSVEGKSFSVTEFYLDDLVHLGRVVSYEGGGGRRRVMLLLFG